MSFLRNTLIVTTVIASAGCSSPAPTQESIETVSNAATASCEQPYAQMPDGCSSWSDNPEQVRDSWGPVNFRTECDKHDRCYYTLGSSANDCNNDFIKNLKRACDNGLTREVKVCVLPRLTGGCAQWLITRTPPVPGTLEACYAIATTMYTAVQVGVLTGVFKEAQDKQRDHEQRCRPAPAQFDKYLVGDWNGDGRDNIAVRRGSEILMDVNYDGVHDILQSYGGGDLEDEYLVGDWDGDGRDNVAVRRGNQILMDVNYDGLHDIAQEYGGGNAEDEYLVGDWDGDGRDNIAVRRGNQILMDTNYDGVHDIAQEYGGGNTEDEYLVGDWDGDGRDNIAVRRGNQILMDTNFDGVHDILQDYGGGSSESQYLVGDWNGDKRANIAVRRGSRVLMDVNYDAIHDIEQAYGNGR